MLGITGMTTNNNDNDSEDSSSIDDNNWMHAEINRHSRGNARPTQTFYDAFGIHAVAKKLKITCAILWNLGACINCLQNFREWMVWVLIILKLFINLEINKF